MHLIGLKSKIHRATVTQADLQYEGSISIDESLCKAAGIHIFEKVDVYNCTNGQRFSTYVIKGGKGEVCVNGAAARLVQPGDLVIIACYASFTEDELKVHDPNLIFVNENNEVIRKNTPEESANGFMIA